jgi:hypothetical protein
MPKGPQELRLDSYVTGGSVDTIRHSAHVWTQGQRVLERLATALETVKPQLMDKFGPQTGPAAAAAFEKVAKNVRDQAAEMQRAGGALTTAADALEDAQAAHHRLGNAPAAPPADATQKSGESSEAFHLRQRDVTASQHHYAAESAARERESQRAIHTVDTKYDRAIKIMESIHGQPARDDEGGGGSGSGSVPGGTLPPRSGTAAGPVSLWHPTTGNGDEPGNTGGGNPDGHDGHDPSGDDTSPGGHALDPPTYDAPGIPQGPGYSDPSVPTTSGGGVPFGPGSHVHLGPSATSTAVGTLISGGIVSGTPGLSNALRTSTMATLTAEEQAALAASRTTGTSGLTGAVAGRGGAVGVTGSSRAGARGTARGGGVGAGGRGDRGRKKRRPDCTDFFENADEWLDDDEASPGVLDQRPPWRSTMRAD